ncbi:MAG: hybrid sensor histidine kinase/response regulator [Polyangiaceae bacterium]|nr:hybrid sensor histidine kinase/response regulator [Polyangiaceae bacterium]
MPRLLHIEDDPANRLLVRKLLTPAGFEVVDAVDGIDGIKKASGADFDIILVDIAIPGLDGYEVTLKLRAESRHKTTPIVAITAEGSRNTSLSVGCDGFLQKPINARSFVGTLEGYLKGQREGISPETSGEHLRAQSARMVSHLEEQFAQLTEANQRLVELDQARKEFYRNISHELSTPMTPIVGYNKLLIDQELGELNPAQLKAMKAMNACVERLRGLIDNLLDVTGIETGRLRFAQQPFDLRESLAHAIAETATIRAEREQELVQDICLPKEIKVRGDGRRISRAIEQLLENASKFGPSHAKIGLRVSSPGASDLLSLIVADQGTGVPLQLRERIFEPFYQIDGSVTRAQGGTGVGLAVARGVARGHGGDLKIAATPSLELGKITFGAGSLN